MARVVFPVLGVAAGIFGCFWLLGLAFMPNGKALLLAGWGLGYCGCAALVIFSVGKLIDGGAK